MPLSLSAQDSSLQNEEVQLSQSQDESQSSSPEDDWGTEEESEVTFGEPNTFWLFFRMILALALIVAIIWLLFRLFRFLNKKSVTEKNDDPYLRRVASISLGANKSVQIVSLLDDAYIIGVTDNSINLISKVENPELVSAMNSNADEMDEVEKPLTFKDLLEKIISRGKSEPKKRQEKKTFDGASAQIMDVLKKQREKFNRDKK